MFRGDGANLQRKFCRSGERVVAGVHRRGTGVRFLSVKGDVVPLHTFGAEHDAERKVHAFEHRALLDMEFEISRRVFALLRRVGEMVDLHATTAKSVFQLDAIAIGAAAIRGDGVRSGKCGRAKQAAAKTRALFIGPIDKTNGDGRLAVKFIGEAAKNFEAGKDIQAAIKPAAIGDGIEMAADDQRFFGGAGKRDPIVARGVVMMLDGKIFEFIGEPFARFEPGVGPGNALSAIFVGGESAKFFEFGNSAFGIRVMAWLA